MVNWYYRVHVRTPIPVTCFGAGLDMDISTPPYRIVQFRLDRTPDGELFYKCMECDHHCGCPSFPPARDVPDRVVEFMKEHGQKFHSEMSPVGQPS